MRLFFRCLICLLFAGVAGCAVQDVEIIAVQDVEIIAHRGASYLAPENTMASVMLGWQKNANVEIDVHLTKDNRIVVIHDSTTKRTAKVNLKVSETTAKELRQLDVGKYKGQEFIGEPIPFLEEVLRTIPPKRKLYVEIKCGREILPFLQPILEDSGKISQIAIIGFNLKTVTEAKQLMPEIPVCWLKGTVKNKQTGEYIPHGPGLVQLAKENGLDGLSVNYRGITREFAEAVRAGGLGLYTWTVDDPEEAIRLVGLEVDGITTNRPEWLRKHLQSEPSDKRNN